MVDAWKNHHSVWSLFPSEHPRSIVLFTTPSPSSPGCLAWSDAATPNSLDCFVWSTLVHPIARAASCGQCYLTQQPATGAASSMLLLPTARAALCGWSMLLDATAGAASCCGRRCSTQQPGLHRVVVDAASPNSPGCFVWSVLQKLIVIRFCCVFLSKIPPGFLFSELIARRSRRRSTFDSFLPM